ncbi:hypothetical protein M408DRAFT_272569 [Serendipita vermifera MAFF 305830]|uniref:Prolyl endopeptidase n=1 Tax=Serendipita vermifera MAFF 305830 TaxID=933852 RepID=A0A0C3BFH7_SERVB|nr:hypothetical protein M408DRAFT_272569 [Serendipita vermifera MAFF 305830]
MFRRQAVCNVLIWTFISSSRPTYSRFASQRFMSTNATSPLRYPAARRGDHIDIYQSAARGKVEVHDPYQWLETSNDETKTWIQAQVDLTEDYLQRGPDRAKLKDLMMQNADFPKFSAPALKGDNRWYWYYNTGLQAQSVLYRSVNEKLPDFTGKEDTGGEIFFDPNVLSTDGTAAITSTAFSRDGEYFAYGISLSGSDFYTVYVRKTSDPFRTTNGERPDMLDGVLDTVRYVKFSSIVWTHDNKGFFYQRYPERKKHGDLKSDAAGTETDRDLNAMLMYHRIGTSQDEDTLVWKDDENPEWMFGVQISETDGNYMAMYIHRDTAHKCKLWITDLSKHEIGNLQWTKLIDEFDSDYAILGNEGSFFYIQTNKDAAREKIVTVDISSEPYEFKELIPEDPEALLGQTAIVHDHIILVYSRNVKDELYVYSKTGEKLQRLEEDFVGSIGISGKPDHSWFFALSTGFTSPGTVHRYDFTAPKEQRWSTYRRTKLKALNPENFVAEQVWYDSKDGTKIPMFIVRPKWVNKDGTASAIQYGYGGFSYSVQPFFSTTLLTYIQSYGAILAVANIRGGAEFGEDWHLAGTRERKVNVFDDFIAATQYLTESGWAAPGKVAINGASNGGLLVAACLNRAPQGTFGAGVAEVGVLDMLKFADFTIGKAWTADYGDPHVAEDFDFIYPYSPLHNVPDHELPPTLILTADHDDRVVPLHSFKHIAELQHKLANNPNPLLIRIEQKAGHGAGKSTEKKIQEAADKWSFVAYSLGLEWKDAPNDVAHKVHKKTEL